MGERERREDGGSNYQCGETWKGFSILLAIFLTKIVIEEKRILISN